MVDPCQGYIREYARTNHVDVKDGMKYYLSGGMYRHCRLGKVDPDNITPEIKAAIITEILHRNRAVYFRLSQI